VERETALEMTRLGIRTRAMAARQLEPLRQAAGAASASGLWFEDSAHVVDPLRAVQVLAQAAAARGAEVRRMEVRALRLRGDRIDILSDAPSLTADAVVVCAGMGAAALLASFGLRAPLQSVRGYHIEIPDQLPFLDAPVLYTHEHVLVTPMTGRLRASTYMEFADADAPADLAKVATLKRKVQSLGFHGEPRAEGWVGARPVLPDYLPGIGRAPSVANLFYAVGHQHIGLTLAPVTGDLVADMMAGRAPRLPIDAFDLRRFGGARQR
jgi:D-amino-acid dehydrogenase